MIRLGWGFQGGTPPKFFWIFYKIDLREKNKIRGRSRWGESYSRNLGKNVKNLRRTTNVIHYLMQLQHVILYIAMYGCMGLYDELSRFTKK